MVIPYGTISAAQSYPIMASRRSTIGPLAKMPLEMSATSSPAVVTEADLGKAADGVRVYRQDKKQLDYCIYCRRKTAWKRHVYGKKHGAAYVCFNCLAYIKQKGR